MDLLLKKFLVFVSYCNLGGNGICFAYCLIELSRWWLKLFLSSLSGIVGGFVFFSLHCFMNLKRFSSNESYHIFLPILLQLAPTSSESLIKALDFIKNPGKLCEHVYALVKELTAKIRSLKLEHRTRGLCLVRQLLWNTRWISNPIVIVSLLLTCISIWVTV